METPDCQLCLDVVSGDKPALESMNFSLIPSVGALAPGHVLLLPKAHYLRLADVPPVGEYVEFQDRAVSLLERTFGVPVHRFEHGSNAAGTRTPCTIEHAHLHLLPAAADVSQRLAGDYDWQPVDPGNPLTELSAGEYLFYQSPDGAAMVTQGSRFPSQYLRRIFADALGVREWNWRNDSRRSVVEETYRRLDAVKIQA